MRLSFGLLFFAVLPQSTPANWPQWRGPAGSAVSSESGLPLEWSRTENVRWRARLPGRGTSTPIVWEERVFLTYQTGSGPLDGRGAEFENARAPRPDAPQAKGVRFFVRAVGRQDGRMLWEYALDADAGLPSVHPKHNLASPSPVTDGSAVYAWFGTGQLVALDLDGKLLWERHLGREEGPFEVLWGHGSSPALYKDLLILQCDHPMRAYLLGLDKSTGQTRWKTDRPQEVRSYSTPLVIERAEGDELVVNSSHRLESYDPATGKLLWYAGEPTTLAIPMPVFAGGVVYASRGYASGPYQAIRLGGRGDVSQTQVKWFFPTRAPYVSSLLYYRDVLYMATEHGIVTGMDPESGAPLFQERLEGAFTASPVAGDDKVYLLNEDGDTYVLAAAREFKLLARNRLDERSLASPAIAGGNLFIRTDESLFCIGR